MKTIFKSILFATLSVFAFTCCEDVPAPYQLPSTENNSETNANEITCAQAVELTNALADNGTSTETYTITGYITEVIGSVSKNQQTFWMADAKDGGRIFEAYYANLPAGVTDFVKGTKVKITGKLTKYVKNNQVTAEMKNATVEILEVGNDDGGNQTTEEGTPATCAQAVELTNALADGATSTETYTITGYITEVFGNVSKNQQSFWMADTKDGGKVFEAYWANLPEGVTEFVVGSKVKITGQLMKYVNKTSGDVTPEIKNATVVILEVGDGGQGGQTTEEGTPVTCAQAVELANALADGGISTETYTVSGYITEVVGSVSRNQQTFWMADEKDGGKVFEAYWANLPEGVSAFVAGSKVKITGQLMKYVDKNGNVTPEIKNANVVILEVGDGGNEGGNEGGGEQGGDTSEYGIGLSYTGGTNFNDNGVATINGVADCKVLKIGTSKAVGDFTLTVPAGKHSFYAVTWKGLGTADVVLKNGEETIQTITVKENDGATQNSPYTFTVTEEDKYEFEVSAACTLTVTSDKRVIFFGIK